MHRKAGFMVQNDEALISKLKNALAAVWAVGDKHDWPVKLSAVSHLFAGEFYEDFHRAFYTLLEKDYSFREIGALIGKPSKAFRSFDLILRGMYMKKVPPANKRRFVCDLLKCIRSMKQGSPFNTDGCNRILSEDDVKEIRDGYTWNTAGIDASKAIHGLVGLLMAYTEMLYFRSYDISREIHGPYETENGGSLLIRAFTDLAPEKLWSGFSFLQCDSVTIYTEYDNSVKVFIDPYNHMHQKGAGFTEHLLRWRITADDREITCVDDILYLKNAVCEAIRANSAFFADKDWRYFTKKYADICWYKIDALLQAAVITDPARGLVDNNIQNGEMNQQSDRFFESNKIGMLLNIML